jgi:6-phosphogluconolactonase (cycloisomerase 2 family)
MRRLSVAILSLALVAGMALVGAVPVASAAAPANPLFLYAVNDGVANSVSAYAIRHDGSLAEIAGSPFATGGAGDAADPDSMALISPSTARLARTADRLYVANMGGSPASISAFAINPRTGTLRALRGSPYSLGFSGEFSLALTPDGSTVFAAQSRALSVETLRVNRDGSLDSRHRTRTAVAIQTDGIAVSSDGRWLALAGAVDLLADEPGFKTQVFSINSRSGRLAESPGSPIVTRATTVAFGPSRHGSATLFAGTLDGTIDDYAVTPTSITKISSLSIGGTYPSLQNLVVANGGSMIYASDPWAQTLYAFRVDRRGNLSLASGPFAASQSRILEGLAMTPDGKRLYYASVGENVDGAAAASIGGVQLGRSGSMTALAGVPVATGQPGWLRSIVIFEGSRR